MIMNAYDILTNTGASNPMSGAGLPAYMRTIVNVRIGGYCEIVWRGCRASTWWWMGGKEPTAPTFGNTRRARMWQCPRCGSRYL